MVRRILEPVRAKRTGIQMLYVCIVHRWWWLGTDTVFRNAFPQSARHALPDVNHLAYISSPLLPWDKHAEFAPQIFPSHEVSRRVRRLMRESRKSNTLAVYQPSCLDGIVYGIRILACNCTGEYNNIPPLFCSRRRPYMYDQTCTF